MEGTIVAIDRNEFELLIRESVLEALNEYDKARKAMDYFRYLPEFLTRKQVADLFDVHSNSVATWTRQGWLPA